MIIRTHLLPRWFAGLAIAIVAREGVRLAGRLLFCLLLCVLPGLSAAAQVAARC